MAPTIKRTKIQPRFISDVYLDLQARLSFRLDEKGDGTIASRHEALGMIAEEYDELLEAVRSGTLADVHMELLDIAVACVFTIACIKAGTMEW